MSTGEINITLFHLPTSKTDAISIPPSTTLADLSNFSMAILGLESEGGVVLAKGQSKLPIYNPTNSTAATDNEGSKTLSQCGLVDGEFISVYTVGEFERMTSASPARSRQRTTATNNTNRSAGGGGGGLDFSSLLGAPAASSSSAASGGMDFTALLSSGAAVMNDTTSSTNSTSAAGEGPIEWDGMTLDDATSRNRNPVQ